VLQSQSLLKLADDKKVQKVLNLRGKIDESVNIGIALTLLDTPRNKSVERACLAGVNRAHTNTHTHRHCNFHFNCGMK
jgi:hypothetical protein